MPRVRANGIDIEYESFGPESGTETVLLIMGLGGQLTMWPAELCEELVRRGYRVIRYDNRDVGLSTRFEHAGMPDMMAIFGALMAGRPAAAPLNRSRCILKTLEGQQNRNHFLEGQRVSLEEPREAESPMRCAARARPCAYFARRGGNRVH